MYPTDTGYAFGCALSSVEGASRRCGKLKGLDERLAQTVDDDRDGAGRDRPLRAHEQRRTFA
jgi:hypothetical protein